MTRLVVVVLACAAMAGCRPKLVDRPEELNLPNTPQVTERTIEFKGTGGLKLAGTLTAPEGSLDTNYPAVLLLPGSGPTDRDGNQPGLTTDVLKQIAVGLAGARIASFRFDKRAVRTVAPQWPKDPNEIGPFFSWSNHVGDVLGAWNAMRTFGLVDGRNCAILGHSEGGILALAVAGAAKPKALILLGTPGRGFGELVHEQLERQLSMGLSADTKAKLLAQNDQVWGTIVRTGKVPSNVPEVFKALYNPSVGVYMQQIAKVSPTKLVLEYPGPVLIINGESDIQVSPTKDAGLLARAAKTRTERQVVLSIVPLASHNLKPVESPTEPGFTGEVVPDVIEAIQRFLVGKIGGRLPNTDVDVR